MAMDRRTYTLICLAEELNEAAQAVAKMARFGIEDHHAGQNYSNIDQARLEFNDVWGMLEVLKLEEGIVIAPNDDQIIAKIGRFEMYREHARSIGTVEK